MSKKDTTSFLPATRNELKKLKWDRPDIIIVTGDAYVDHPGFGAAIIGRVLEDRGFRVAIISQPRWDSTDDFTKFGQPRLFFAVTAGNTDSMVSNYTPALRPRKHDSYSPGNKPGKRPDRAVIVYSNRIKEAYPDTTIITGGIEASLRRFAHYDYWSDSVRKSILADAPADLLVYGMGELQMLEIAERMNEGIDAGDITDIDGTVWKMRIRDWRNGGDELAGDYIQIPSYDEVSSDREKYCDAFATICREQDPIRGRNLVQKHPKTIIIQNRPMRPLDQQELDHVYELPFTRKEHPSCNEPVSALETVRFSITTHRGCFGSCSFCAIGMHQGRIVSSRSIQSILQEARTFTEMREFRGVISGVGGPTANMYSMKCKKWEKSGTCADKLCLYPEPCHALDKDSSQMLEMFKKLKEIPGISKVFVGYGVRYDLAGGDREYMYQLCKDHVSGQLLVAPEHYSDNVTSIMKKPGRKVFERFASEFEQINRELSKEQYLVTYLMSGHPGCTIDDMVNTAEYIRDTGRYTEQVQEFTPTPMTVSTCMYHTGLDPFTKEKVHVSRSRKDKRIQRAMLHYRNPKNRSAVYEGLKQADRLDLIGNAWKCLISRRKRK